MLTAKILHKKNSMLKRELLKVFCAKSYVKNPFHCKKFFIYNFQNLKKNSLSFSWER